jgi:uncharacterized protein
VHEMRVMAIGVEPGAYRPVLLLEEASGDHRILPVWIGPAEANAITMEQRGISGPRPMTHQLIGHVLAAFGRRLEQVQITEVRDNIFYAELILDRNTRLTARVSDAVALALHLGIPIHAEDTVLDTVAVSNTVTQVPIHAEDKSTAGARTQGHRRADGRSVRREQADGHQVLARGV